MVEDVVRHFGYLTLGTRLKRVGERLQSDTQKMIDAHGASGEGCGSAETREVTRLFFERAVAPANRSVPRASPASAR